MSANGAKNVDLKMHESVDIGLDMFFGTVFNGITVEIALKVGAFGAAKVEMFLQCSCNVLLGTVLR